jgi:hypothetical protein
LLIAVFIFTTAVTEAAVQAAISADDPPPHKSIITDGKERE